MKYSKKIIILFFAVFSLALQSCTNKASFHWQFSRDMKACIWTENTTEFDWTGGTKGCFADGNGEILFYSTGEKTTVKNVCFLFGAEEKDYKQLSESTKYVGEYKNYNSVLTPNGKGVFIKSNGDVYAGNVQNGKPNGEAYHFVSGILQYEGNFKDGKYSGNGKFYKDGHLLFSGTFENGVQNGEGIEYQDGAEFSGNYINGKKNGIFKISRNGTVRVVNYIDGIPNLSDCKIYYANGDTWEGALNSNYEPIGIGKHTTSEGFITFENRENGEINGSQKVTFKDGSIYDGDIKNGKRDGYGTQTYSSGVVYVGDWENDKQNGEGDYFIDNDWHYTGSWKDGVFDGDGIYVFSSSIYDGEWKNGKKNGFGSLKTDSFLYEGQWENNELSGQGVLEFSDGTYYEGNFKNSKRNGYGEYFWSDGSSYSGDWVDDYPHGEGYAVLSNGDTYLGDFESCTDGKRIYTFYSGYGAYTFSNGERYEGTFVENRRAGFGTYYYENGNIYEGEFEDNIPNGKGCFSFLDETYYEGNFNNGKLSGTGSLYIPVDDSYIIFSSDNWSDKSELPNYGSMLFPNGDEFIGSFENGNPISGTWTTREERDAQKKQELQEKYNVKTLEHTRFEEFAKKHEVGLKKFFSIAKTVVTVTNLAATIAGFIPIPPVTAVANAVGVVCDIADVALAAGDIAFNTAVYSYDKKEAIKDLDENRIFELKKNYKTALIDDGLTIALTGVFAGINAVRAGKQAKKIMESSPEIAKTLQALKSAQTAATTAKSSKITGKLIGGVVELAYPGIGKTLVKEYGDDAAKLIFKYGENAISAITLGGENVLKLAATKNGKQAINVLLQNGDSALEILAKNSDKIDDIAKLFAKHGKEGLEFAKKLGNSFIYIYAKYGDEAIELFSKLGKNNGRLAVNIIEQYGDEALKVLLKIAHEEPNNLNKAVKYISARGKDGLSALRKNTVDLSKLTLRSIKTSGSLLKKLKPIIAKYLSKGAINLTKEELELAKNDKSFLRAFMKKFDCENLDEFLIRLKEGSPKQVEELLGVCEKNGKYVSNGRTAARDFLDNYIRQGGGNHEFLLTQNYADFLLNPKWGDDGAAIAMCVKKLIQKTKDVKIDGFSHYDLYGIASKLVKEQNPAAWKAARDGFEESIHSMSDVMSNSSDIGSLFENVKDYVTKVLDPESAEKFLEIWNNCVR